ncbi:MAG: T9SS type A sorting domain-containing protein, partial [Bacteroidota bacterium]
LDGWHEWKHPSHWSKDFYIEGENFDQSTTGGSSYEFKRATERPNNLSGGDFSEFTSYITLDGTGAFPTNGNSPEVSFTFHPRDINNQADLYCWVRARAKGAADTGIILMLEEVESGIGVQDFSIKPFNDPEWQWYQLDLNDNPVVLSNLSRQQYRIRLRAMTSALEIDEFRLTASNYPPQRLANEAPALEAEKLSLIPNPANDKLSVSWELGEQEAASIELVDLQGRVLKKVAIIGAQGSQKLKLNAYNAGVYLVVLTDKNGQRITKKLILN